MRTNVIGELSGAELAGRSVGRARSGRRGHHRLALLRDQRAAQVGADGGRAPAARRTASTRLGEHVLVAQRRARPGVDQYEVGVGARRRSCPCGATARRCAPGPRRRRGRRPRRRDGRAPPRRAAAPWCCRVRAARNATSQMSPAALLLQRGRRVVGGHVGQHAVAQQPPHLRLVLVGAGPRGRGELAQRPLLEHLVLAEQEVLRAGLLGGQPAPRGPLARRRTTATSGLLTCAMVARAPVRRTSRAATAAATSSASRLRHSGSTPPS